MFGEQAEYYSFDKFYGLNSSTSAGFYTQNAICWGIGLGTYVYCTKYLKSLRWMSSAIMTAVPLSIILSRKAEDAYPLLATRPITL
jgi:hypothetical protein